MPKKFITFPVPIKKEDKRINEREEEMKSKTISYKL